MDFVTGKDLSLSFHKACKIVHRRFWIASPYIGGWDSVRRLVGRKWWDLPGCEVRLLTDIEEGGVNGATVQRLAQRGPVHSLRGLHAKLYIIDNRVLLTSANLTGTAFSSRYEAGVWLDGQLAAEVIQQYEHWWGLSERLNPDTLGKIAKGSGKAARDDETNGLVVLNQLPKDVGDFGDSKFINIFRDYPAFLDDYRTLATEYVAVQRIWPRIALNFEIDGFLDYLFRHHPKVPSKRFEKDDPRKLSKVGRRSEIRRLAPGFRAWAEQEDPTGNWRMTHSKSVRRILSKRGIRTITRDQIREVVEGLNCMNDNRQKSRFLKFQNNSTTGVRRAWEELLYGTQPVTERMSVCAGRLFGFKRSSIQELLGFFAPNEYPLRNATVNAGLRFFGFDVTPH